ncbi:hypothetical protein PIB30_099948, partial [Stylosanthes scabra]|nr:hypothetical protein [Stylosanthes scabra]
DQEVDQDQGGVNLNEDSADVLADEGGQSNEEDIDTNDGEDSDDGEYIPEEEVTNSADDIHFTDSDDELDLNDNGFGGEGLPAENANADKGKRALNDDFHGDEGEESDDMEGLHPVGGYDRDEDAEGDDEDEAEVRMFPMHKPVADMKNYPWRVGTLYANRDEFKETVSSFAVHTARGIQLSHCDRMRVIAICKPGCPFRLYAMKMSEEDSWQLRPNSQLLTSPASRDNAC